MGCAAIHIDTAMTVELDLCKPASDGLHDVSLQASQDAVMPPGLAGKAAVMNGAVCVFT